MPPMSLLCLQIIVTALFLSVRVDCFSARPVGASSIATKLRVGADSSTPAATFVNKRIKQLCFSSGGIFFWWQAGVCKYMLEQGFPRDGEAAGAAGTVDVEIHGTSAGALAAALLACGCDFDRAADIAIQQAVDRNLFADPKGLAFVWGELVREWLNELIPAGVSAAHLGRVTVVVTPLVLPAQQRVLGGFTDKADLIDACMASVHIPLFMDKQLWSEYKGECYVDGSLWPFLLGSGFDTVKRYGREEVYTIGWQQDEQFAQKVNDREVNFLSLISPQLLREMMNDGYAYMKRQHALGLAPL